MSSNLEGYRFICFSKFFFKVQSKHRTFDDPSVFLMFFLKNYP
jgi:hypothetical protein